MTGDQITDELGSKVTLRSSISTSTEANMATQHPESRVLIVMTGGTICMRSSPEGLVPARGFLEAGMKPRPSFNDGSNPGKKDGKSFPYLRWNVTVPCRRKL